LWVTRHINPFFEPFAGFLIEDNNAIIGRLGSQTYFDGGLFSGVDLLVSNWGIRLWTGFEAIVGGGTHYFGIPVRWALVVYI
jgi:hypothetical protein